MEDGTEVNVMLIDIAGQERFRSISLSYIKKLL